MLTKLDGLVKVGLWYLMPLSTIFQLYRGSLLNPFGFIAPKTLYYLVFQSFDFDEGYFERT